MTQNFKPTQECTEAGFNLLLCMAFATVFIGQSLTHITAMLYVIWLLITRPKLPWIPAFWWLVGFAIWEWVSHFFGPYPGDGIEGGGNGYHFLILLLPLLLQDIDYSKLLKFITVGALFSALLIWAQSLIGVDLNNTPLRINWSGDDLFSRAPGFNSRPWETQFIHSMVLLTIFSQLDWRKTWSWLTGIALSTGVILPLIRAVIAAFIAALSIQLIFSDKTENNRVFLKRLATIAIISILCIGTIAALRPDFFNSLTTGNGRDRIFSASYEIFLQHPHTGIGGGEHFQSEYQSAWKHLGMPTDTEKDIFLYSKIGHAHNDILFLLSHNGWPALLLWSGFIIHCLIFVLKNGNRQDKVLFISLSSMHFIAGLSETYLDYSNTIYTLLLCYGLALHNPYRRYLKQHNHIKPQF